MYVATWIHHYQDEDKSMYKMGADKQRGQTVTMSETGLSYSWPEISSRDANPFSQRRAQLSRGGD
jgi:hypothetical protein